MASAEAALAMERLELGLLIMDTYIRYPLPTDSRSLIPYNYCALPRVKPWLAPLLRPFCPPLQTAERR